MRGAFDLAAAGRCWSNIVGGSTTWSSTLTRMRSSGVILVLLRGYS